MILSVLLQMAQRLATSTSGTETELIHLRSKMLGRSKSLTAQTLAVSRCAFAWGTLTAMVGLIIVSLMTTVITGGGAMGVTVRSHTKLESCGLQVDLASPDDVPAYWQALGQRFTQPSSEFGNIEWARYEDINGDVSVATKTTAPMC